MAEYKITKDIIGKGVIPNTAVPLGNLTPPKWIFITKKFNSGYIVNGVVSNKLQTGEEGKFLVIKTSGTTTTDGAAVAGENEVAIDFKSEAFEPASSSNTYADGGSVPSDNSQDDLVPVNVWQGKSNMDSLLPAFIGFIISLAIIFIFFYTISLAWRVGQGN